jgi:hypothetical protein
VPKSEEQYKQEILDLYVKAGHKQHIIRGIRQTLDGENNALNTLNQQLEKALKEYNIFKLSQPSATEPIPTVLPEAPPVNEPSQA